MQKFNVGDCVRVEVSAHAMYDSKQAENSGIYTAEQISYTGTVRDVLDISLGETIYIDPDGARGPYAVNPSADENTVTILEKF